MKKMYLVGIMVCLSMLAFAQRSMEWYSYWGSNVSGNQIEAKRMVADADGNLYVAALFGGTKVAVESKTLNSNSSQDKGDAVVIKMTDAKTVLWTYPIVSAGSATISDLALCDNGDVVAIGSFNNKIKVGSQTLQMDDSNMGEAAIYVLKISASGQGLAAWQIPALGAKAGKVAIDSEGNIIVVGLLDGDATFVPGGDPEGDFQNSAQMFIAKYDEDGTLLWHIFRNDPGATSQYGLPSVALDEDDNIYVASAINGSTTLMEDPIVTSTSNAFIMAYNEDGDELWYHLITGSRSDVAADIAVSPIGEVAMAINHQSEDLQIDGAGDIFNNGYSADISEAAAYQHTAIFSFTLAGNIKWFYDWGYWNVVSGADAICNALRCTDEGVWYVAGIQTGRYGATRMADSTIPSGKNSGVESIDHQWLAHNTNGGRDAFLLTLTRGGLLANVIRPGGIQYEDGIDVALSPDKKKLYFLMLINVRNKEPYTCPDNIFDSFTDLYAPTAWASRKSDYTLLNVFCPENNGTATPYTEAYKGIFASSMLVKYQMPEINPNQLPNFTVDEAYSQSLALSDAAGEVTLFPLETYADVNFDGAVVSGTFADDVDRYVGVLAIDSIALPGEITYYEYDALTRKSIRSNPRNCRYMALKEGTFEAIDQAHLLEASVYPTYCPQLLNIRCDKKQYTVSIYASDGRMIFSKENIALIGIQGYLAAGTYYVEVSSGSLRNVTPIIVH